MAEQSPIVKNLIASLSDVKDQLKTKGVQGVVRDTLIANKGELEIWYAKVLAQNGVLTEEEKQRLSDSLDSAKKKALQASVKEGKTKMLIIGITSVVVIAGIIWYVYKKRKS